MSTEQDSGWLGYIGSDITTSYIGIILQAILRIPINQPPISRGMSLLGWAFAALCFFLELLDLLVFNGFNLVVSFFHIRPGIFFCFGKRVALQNFRGELLNFQNWGGIILWFDWWWFQLDFFFLFLTFNPGLTRVLFQMVWKHHDNGKSSNFE